MIRQNASEEPGKLPFSAIGPAYFGGQVHLVFLEDTNRAQAFCGLWEVLDPNVPVSPRQCYLCWNKWSKLTGILRYLMDS